MFDPLENSDDVITCNRFNACGWTGLEKDLVSKYIHTNPESWMMLAGREGYVYYCPNCGSLVTERYWRMS